MSQWTAEAVQTWLLDLGFDDVADRFAAEAIDGEALMECREEDLRALGIDRLGDRKRLMKQLRLRQAHDADTGLSVPRAGDRHDYQPGDPEHFAADRLQSAFSRGAGDGEYEAEQQRMWDHGCVEEPPRFEAHSEASADPEAYETAPRSPLVPGRRVRLAVDFDAAEDGGSYGGPAGGAPPPPADPQSNDASPDNPLAPANRARLARDFGAALDRGFHGGGAAGGAPPPPADPQSNEASPDNPLVPGNRARLARDVGAAADRGLRRGAAGAAAGPPPGDLQSNEASPDNPLVPGHRGRLARDFGAAADRGCGVGKGKGGGQDPGVGKGDGKNSNYTSTDNPLAAGNYWGSYRGLAERPAVLGEVKDRVSWRDDPGPGGRAM